MAGVDATIIPLDVTPVVVIGNAITPIAACALFVYRRFHFFYSVELTCYLTDQFEKVKSEPVYFFVTDIEWADSTKDVLVTIFSKRSGIQSVCTHCC